jgi:phage terminase small subunit
MSSRAVQPDLLNGLSRLQRTFVLEKIMGANDKNAALAAGYSLSVAENTKEKVWKPKVRAEFQRLTEVFVLEVEPKRLRKSIGYYAVL